MAAFLTPNAKQQFFDNAGVPAAGFKLYTYAAGTVTPQATYTNRAGSVANANPIILDARGEAVIYLTPGLVYDYVLHTAADVLVWTRPGVDATTNDAASVTFTQFGSGMVERSVQDKNRDIVHADDRGLIGDASDETTGLQALLTAAQGKVLMLGYGKVYGFDGAVGLTFPADTTLITNGSTFKKRTSNVSISTYGITVGDHCNIDRIALEIPGGSSDTGIKISGSGVSVGRVEVTSLVNDAGYLSPVNGLLVNNAAGTVTDVSIGSISVSGHSAPVRYLDVDGLQVGFTRISNYRIGVYLNNVKNAVLTGARITGLSPSALGGAGNNGWLLQTDTTLASYNIKTIGYHIEDSGEHAFRIGSDRQCDNISFIGCSSRNTGAIAGVSTGGAAFKVLCGNTTSEYHTNISVIGFCAEDCSELGAGLANHAAIQFGKVRGGVISNCIVRRNNNPTYSCKFGIQLFVCEDIQVSDNTITDAMRHAIWIVEATVVAPPYPTASSRINISGGSYHVVETLNSSPVLRVTAGASVFTTISVSNVLLRGGGAAALYDAPTTGSYANMFLDCTYVDPGNIAGAPPISNIAGLTLNYRGPYYGTFAPIAANGSIFQDLTSGLVKIRKAGAWNTL